MQKIKKWILAGALSAFGAVYGQQAIQVSGSFPSSAEHQSNPLLSSASPEKLLTPKEYFDINVNGLMNDPVLRNAHWGYVVYDPKTKKIVSSYNETDSFVPASTTKILTTETALALLGSKYRWLTQLEYSGEIDEQGTLNGNLYIIGSGDPSLGTGKAGASTYSGLVSDFVFELKGKGINKVTGDIIIQNAVFKENQITALPENIVWSPKNNYYLPVGTTRDIEPRNEQLIVKKKNPFNDGKEYYYISPYIKKLVYADKFENNYLTTKLPDAPAYLANQFRASLLKNGVPVSGKVVSRTIEPNTEKTYLITTYRSPTLKEIVVDTNHRSDNALAEALLRMVGFQKAGDQTLESGRMVVVNHLRDVNFDTSGLNYVDGSGLSRSNLVTPIAHVKFLSDLMKESHYQDFLESLPTAGQSGTLKKSFMGNSYGQIFAKTGTLNKVKTLAGYLKTRSGKMLAFSLMINNYSGSVDQVKRKMEQILDPAIDL